MKIYKTFAFWFIILSLLVILQHQTGSDPKGILLINFNPILQAMACNDTTSNFMRSGFEIECKTLAGSISIFWYIGSVITMAFYGGILDLLKIGIKKIISKVNEINLYTTGR